MRRTRCLGFGATFSGAPIRTLRVMYDLSCHTHFNLGTPRIKSGGNRCLRVEWYCMTRGRPRSVSDERLLVELLIHPDRAVFTTELADIIDVENQTIRDRMKNLEQEGYVKIDDVSGVKLYRLTEEGMTYLRELLRSEFQ